MYLNALSIKTIFAPIAVITLMLTAIGALAYFDSSAIIIESLESKNMQNEPIFNRISFQPGRAQDIWLMNQSHTGPQQPVHSQDRLAIVVNKQQNTVQFYQFENGDIYDVNMTGDTKQIDFKVSCFLCHSNGPRAIRPNTHSLNAKLSPWSRFRIQMLNLRVKTYGRLQQVPTKFESDHAKVKFRWAGERANTPLQIKTCQKCHNESGVFARGTLTRQNFMAIEFLTAAKIMPPLGFALSPAEVQQLRAFLN